MKLVAFVNSKLETRLLPEAGDQLPVLRITLDNFKALRPRIPRGAHLWIDPGIDGFHNPPSGRRTEWADFIKQFPGHELLDDSRFVERPKKEPLFDFLKAILDQCKDTAPLWLTVPQLPVVDDVSRNKINRTLAELTRDWARQASFTGELVLPAIFTNQRQLNQKTARNKKLSAVKASIRRSGATVVWSVDATLQDQSGSKTLQRSRFPGLLSWHKELNGALPPRTLRVAGPYWGLNLVLWARGDVDLPAIGLGGSFQYHFTGGTVRPPLTRIALPPLRRWAVKVPELKVWLKDSLARIAPDDPSRKPFEDILVNFDRLNSAQASRRQIARFYRGWCDKLAQSPEAGRALSLYQDLSSAYVLGKSFSDLPRKEGTARRPEVVAQQLMLSCL